MKIGWCLVALAAATVIDFQEYTGTRLSEGPYLSLDEYAFTRTPIGGVREVTVECWLYLRDWDDNASIISRPFFSAADASAAGRPRIPAIPHMARESGDR